MTETKKISFGFNKSTKKPNILPTTTVDNDKIELIDCFEEQFMKLKGYVNCLLLLI